MAGRVGPFLELGVGFNPELSARENIVINGVHAGAHPGGDDGSPRLGDGVRRPRAFAEAKLKHFSSGMRLRLGFSVMVQADSRRLPFDEVMSVGDAAYQQKASETFLDLKDRGKTVILVTHSMTAIEELCDRAMLLERGEVAAIGATDDVTARYLELNREQAEADPAAGSAAAKAAATCRSRRVFAPGSRARACGVVARPVASTPASRSRSRASSSSSGLFRGTRLWLELRDAHGTRLFADSATLDESRRDLAPRERLRVHARSRTGSRRAATP